MNIREHIINNFKGDDYESLRNAIDESIKEQDEVTLPGMGVFFEIVWNGADSKLQDEILEIIKERVASGTEQDNDNNSNNENQDVSSEDEENTADEDENSEDDSDNDSDENYDEDNSETSSEEDSENDDTDTEYDDEKNYDE